MFEDVARRLLRAVFGGGADISAANPLEVHDPKVGSLISYEGTTTADGAPGGTTLVCADLVAPAHPDFDGNLVIITSGAYDGQARDINGVTTGGIVTPFRPFGGQIVAGTNFVIAGITTTPAEVAAIEAKLDLPAPNVALNTRIAEVVGNKADAAVGVVGVVASIIAYVKGILNAIAALPLVGILHEQAAVPFSVNAALAEANIFDLSALNTRYVVRSLRLKCVDPAGETVTVRLYELVNTVLTLVDSFDITTANFATAHSLMDMFGLPHLAGNNLRVAVIATAAGPYACTGQYSFALAT